MVNTSMARPEGEQSAIDIARNFGVAVADEADAAAKLIASFSNCKIETEDASKQVHTHLTACLHWPRHPPTLPSLAPPVRLLCPRLCASFVPVAL